jgi:hypothetical protein
LFNRINTILINGNLEKCVCNEIGNPIFLLTWTCQALIDDFLLNVLVPWLLWLYTNCNLGQLKDYVNTNRTRVSPLAAISKLLLHIAREMALSHKNFGIQYNIVGVSGFLIPKIL